MWLQETYMPATAGPDCPDFVNPWLSPHWLSSNSLTWAYDVELYAVDVQELKSAQIAAIAANKKQMVEFGSRYTKNAQEVTRTMSEIQVYDPEIQCVPLSYHHMAVQQLLNLGILLMEYDAQQAYNVQTWQFEPGDCPIPTHFPISDELSSSIIKFEGWREPTLMCTSPPESFEEGNLQPTY